MMIWILIMDKNFDHKLLILEWFVCVGVCVCVSISICWPWPNTETLKNNKRIVSKFYSCNKWLFCCCCCCCGVFFLFFVFISLMVYFCLLCLFFNGYKLGKLIWSSSSLFMIMTVPNDNNGATNKMTNSEINHVTNRLNMHNKISIIISG